MRRVKDVMNRRVRPVELETTLREAARVMDRTGTSIVPVVEHDEVVGAVTEHDIVARAVAASKDPGITEVGSVMRDVVSVCYENQPVEEALRIMSESHEHDLLVISRDGMLVGACSARDVEVTS
jgi:CBS domain-containing protein